MNCEKILWKKKCQGWRKHILCDFICLTVKDKTDPWWLSSVFISLLCNQVSPKLWASTNNWILDHSFCESEVQRQQPDWMPLVRHFPQGFFMVLTRSIISKHSQGGGICFHVHSCGCGKSQGLMAVGLETLVLVYTSLFILASLRLELEELVQKMTQKTEFTTPW